jgi:hypothetical protein
LPIAEYPGASRKKAMRRTIETTASLETRANFPNDRFRGSADFQICRPSGCEPRGNLEFHRPVEFHFLFPEVPEIRRM